MKSYEKYPTARLVGNEIRKLRLEYGLTASELGALIGVSQQQMSRYELGTNRIDIDTLSRLTYIFKVNIFYFFKNVGFIEDN